MSDAPRPSRRQSELVYAFLVAGIYAVLLFLTATAVLFRGRHPDAWHVAAMIGVLILLLGAPALSLFGLASVANRIARQANNSFDRVFLAAVCAVTLVTLAIPLLLWVKPFSFVLQSAFGGRE